MGEIYMNSDSSKRFRTAVLFILIVLLQLCFLLPYSRLRMIARDEGFYLMAARLVMHGHLPYSDFFYPQMPLLPYLYGLWMKLFGFTWISARSLSALLSAALGSLIYLRLLKKGGHAAAAAGLFLYATASLTYPWFITAKAYVLSTALLFAAYMSANSETRQRPLLAGVLLGLSAMARLHLILLWPVFAIYFWKRGDKLCKAALIRLCIGTLIPFLAVLPLLLNDSEAFLFNNIEYHLLRSNLDLANALKLKYSLLATLLGLVKGRIFDNFQFILLALGTLLYAALHRSAAYDLALPLALVLFVISFLPTPAYAQYFCALLPFLVICSVMLISDVRPTGVFTRRLISLVVLLLTLRYLAMTPHFWTKYTILCKAGNCYGGLTDATEWSIKSLRTAADEINRLTRPNEMVFAQWPGVLFESHALPLPGTENQFGRHIAKKLSKASRGRFRVLNRSDEVQTLLNEQPRLIILRKNSSQGRLAVQLEKLGYRPKTVIGDAFFFFAPSPGP
jgi:hypothetical protein